MAEPVAVQAVRSVHAFGFYRGEEPGRPDLPVKANPSELTVAEHFTRLTRHHGHFGDVMRDIYVTRPLGLGVPVRIEWWCPPRLGGTRPMWHLLTEPGDVWPDFDPNDQEKP